MPLSLMLLPSSPSLKWLLLTAALQLARRISLKLKLKLS
jgi:hypothetical protein